MGNARKNTFPDRKDSTVRDVTRSPKSAGKILKEAGWVFFSHVGDDVFCHGHHRLYCSLCDDGLHCGISGR